MRALVLLVLASGCYYDNAPAAPPAAAAIAPVRAPSSPPALVYDVERPLEDHGVSQLGVDAHVYSVEPEPGDLFGLTFAVPGVGLRFELPRAWITVGEAQSFEDVGASLFVIAGDRTCVDWSGEFIVDALEPTSWSVYLDASCTADPTLRLQGQWSGQ